MEEQSQIVAAKENVLIEAGDSSVTILPQFGGKIASIRVGRHELMQAPLAPVSARTQTMPFDQGDASGWDECLPSVAACGVETAAGPAQIPDHGDLWRVAWEVVRKDRTSATCRGKCFSLPLTLERTLALSQLGPGSRLSLEYSLANTSDRPVPWSWAAHCLFAVEEGDSVRLPDSVTALRLEGSGGGRLGQGGDSVSWPVATLAAGGQTDLRHVQSFQSGIGDKLFTGPLAPADNWCELLRPKAGLRIRISFDTLATPYLGLWLCYGGWPDRRGPKQYCIAPEPSTAPVDSLAQTGPWSRLLAPGESFTWATLVEIEPVR